MGIRVVLLEDEELVRGGIRLILESDPGIEVAAEAADGSGVVELIAKHRPDVVVTDIQMPRVDGLEVTKRVAALPDPPAVLVLTTFDVDEYVHAALQAGASGFLLKDTPPRELAAAVHTVASGEAMLSPRITKRLLGAFAAGKENSDARRRIDQLTPREREVAVSVAQGLSNAEIAAHLYMSPSTVKVHLGRIMGKLGAANRTQVAIVTHDAGLV
ncbi:MULTISPECIES: response regulator transcription factor [Saccharopolyspora]|uniref:response regulator n=1 Tax=Saccharopolyspora TaxID=1835 RepID=UPI001CD1CDD0|nr:MULTISPECIES: response regulator transcription factor [Saccharopolyspora]MCA1187474.1 response regulator transcription factor [Saccharopolyspora sp. 6T]MCA1194703.1 response regulator transcription factor [Saccharopolyspora sp. 6V]MCA1225861.1 response regulator transcription factor [Saccharopolyspora sp. 6M]MCA1280608.1 response regulator transcription factor [Saccharopolyspora sp. 7B]